MIYLDDKILCPKCKKGWMERLKKRTLIIFNIYVGFKCPKCDYIHHLQDVRNEWNEDYRENINLEIENKH